MSTFLPKLFFFGAAVAFGAAYLSGIKASNEFVKTASEFKGETTLSEVGLAIHTATAGVKIFYKKNEYANLLFIGSATVLAASGLFYNGSDTHKIMGIGSLIASVYTFKKLDQAFAGEKPVLERLQNVAK